MSNQTKKVNFRVDRGIRINGESIFPAKGKSKAVVIGIKESLAKELEAANKGAIVADKPTKQIKDKSEEELELDAAFGASDNGEE